MLWLGTAYEHGQGVAKDDWRAFDLWRRSHELGWDPATEKLQSLSDEYRKKAEKGNASAQFYMGLYMSAVMLENQIPRRLWNGIARPPSKDILGHRPSWDSRFLLVLALPRLPNRQSHGSRKPPSKEILKHNKTLAGVCSSARVAIKTRKRQSHGTVRPLSKAKLAQCSILGPATWKGQG